MLSPTTKIYVAGHRGLLGKSLVQQLQAAGYNNLVTRTRAETDLRNQSLVEQIFAKERPEVVILSAARVAGQQAVREHPADYLHANLAIGLNVIDAARRWGVKKLLLVTGPWAYQTDFNRFAHSDFSEESGSMAGNLPLAMAQRSVVTLAQAYAAQYNFNISIAVPSHLYGPGEIFEPSVAQVIPSLFAKRDGARERQTQTVELDGSPDEQQDFLYVDDAASALVALLKAESGSVPVMIAANKPTSYQQLAQHVAQLVRYDGQVSFVESSEVFMPYQATDTSRINALGWQAKTSLSDGLQQLYQWWLAERNQPRGMAARAARAAAA
jgi:GDP-L-fucose synthase